MSRTSQKFILVSASLSGALLAGCGQKGPLFLPTGEVAAGRASLPQTLRPTAVEPANPASAPTGAAQPVLTP